MHVRARPKRWASAPTPLYPNGPWAPFAIPVGEHSFAHIPQPTERVSCSQIVMRHVDKQTDRLSARSGAVGPLVGGPEPTNVDTQAVVILPGPQFSQPARSWSAAAATIVASACSPRAKAEKHPNNDSRS
jgi:hypothetical protein